MKRWCPTAFRRFIEAKDSSTGVARIVTDAGEGFIKALGNPAGPHALAREWIGTSLARRLGLDTFDISIMTVTPDDEIPLGHKCSALPGPAIVTRTVRGFPWGGDSKTLGKLQNPESITRLVVVDTLLLNADRWPPIGADRRPNYDNVFLMSEGKAAKCLRLIAIDFSHCLLGGADLTRNIRRIEHVKDDRIYGLFPEFAALLDEAELNATINAVGGLEPAAITAILNGLPDEWKVSRETRDAVGEFLILRGRYVAGHLPSALSTYFAKQLDLEKE